MNVKPRLASAPLDPLLVAYGILHLPRGAAIHVDGASVGSRLARIILESHAATPGRPLEEEELSRALWPEQPFAPKSHSRVRVAVCRLRALGLPILTLGRGYALDPRVEIRAAARGAAA